MKIFFRILSFAFLIIFSSQLFSMEEKKHVAFCKQEDESDKFFERTFESFKKSRDTFTQEEAIQYAHSINKMFFDKTLKEYDQKILIQGILAAEIIKIRKPDNEWENIEKIKKNIYKKLSTTDGELPAQELLDGIIDFSDDESIDSIKKTINTTHKNYLSWQHLRARYTRNVTLRSQYQQYFEQAIYNTQEIAKLITTLEEQLQKAQELRSTWKKEIILKKQNRDLVDTILHILSAKQEALSAAIQQEQKQITDKKQKAQKKIEKFRSELALLTESSAISTKKDEISHEEQLLLDYQTSLDSITHYLANIQLGNTADGNNTSNGPFWWSKLLGW